MKTYGSIDQAVEQMVCGITSDRPCSDTARLELFTSIKEKFLMYNKPNMTSQEIYECKEALENVIQIWQLKQPKRFFSKLDI